MLPTYVLSEFAARRVKVVLGGDGADELFAGYDSFVADRLDALSSPFDGAKRRLLEWLAARWPAIPTLSGFDTCC